MKKAFKRLIVLSLALVFTLSFVGCSKNYTQIDNVSDRNAYRAKQLFEQMYKDYVDESLDLVYRTDGHNDGDDRAISGDWHVASLLHAGITVLKHFPDNATIKAQVDFLYKNMEYFVQARTDGYLVYSVQRGTQPGQAPIATAFDDQAYIAQVYYEAYMVTGEEKYMDKIDEILRFLKDVAWFTGINEATGEPIGGFSWGEGHIGFLPICMNGPMVKLFICLYRIETDAAKKAEHLEWAVKTYDYIRKWSIMGNGLVENGRGCTPLGDNKWRMGEPDPTYHTYSNGFAIDAAAKLYSVTNDKAYLDEAIFMADAAHALMTVKTDKPELVQYMQTYYEGGNWFTMILFESYLELAKYDDKGKTYAEDFQKALDHAYDNYYYNGYLPTNYVSGWVKGWQYDEVKQILNEMAPIVMYSYLADYYKA